MVVKGDEDEMVLGRQVLRVHQKIHDQGGYDCMSAGRLTGLSLAPNTGSGTFAVTFTNSVTSFRLFSLPSVITSEAQNLARVWHTTREDVAFS